jgi:hypothetical protein
MAGADTHPRTQAVVEFNNPRETLTIRHDVEKLGDRRRPDAERWLERPFVDRDQSDHEDDAGGEMTSARLVEMHRGKADLRHQGHPTGAKRNRQAALVAGLEPSGDLFGGPSFRKRIAGESPQRRILAQLIGSGGMKRRITPAGQGVASQFPPYGFRSLKRPGDGADRVAGRPHDGDLVSFLVQ